MFGSHFSNLDRRDVPVGQFDLVRPPSHTVEVGEVKLWEGGLLGVHEVDLPHLLRRSSAAVGTLKMFLLTHTTFFVVHRGFSIGKLRINIMAIEK